MRTDKQFHLNDRVTIMVGKRETASGWIRGKLYSVPIRYDVQTEAGLVRDAAAEQIQPEGANDQ